MRRPALSNADREYYRQVWGFDPVTDAHPSLERYCVLPGMRGEIADGDEVGKVGKVKKPVVVQGDYRYYQDFPLMADPALNAVNLKIRASVDVVGADSHTSIWFLRGSRHEQIKCVHTVVYAGPAANAISLARDFNIAEPYPPGIAEIFTRVGGPVELPPWEHFAALKSYVAAIAEMGIGNILRQTLPAGADNGIEVPFGFNASMRAQVIKVLRKLVPTASRAFLRDFFLEMADNVPREWLNDNFPMLDACYGFCHAFLMDLSTFVAVKPALDIRLWRDACAFTPLAPHLIRQEIAREIGDKELEPGDCVSTQRLLAWFQCHPTDRISLFPREYRVIPPDIVHLRANRIVYEAIDAAGEPPRVRKYALSRFASRFEKEKWVILKVANNITTPAREACSKALTPREEWRALRTFFDTARRGKSVAFERQMEALDIWHGIRRLVTQDAGVFRALCEVAKTLALHLMAVLYPRTSPEVLGILHVCFPGYDMGIEALVELALRGSLQSRKVNLSLYPPVEYYCGIPLVREEAIALRQVQEEVAPDRVIPALNQWYVSDLQTGTLHFDAKGNHVTRLHIGRRSGTNLCTLAAKFPYLNHDAIILGRDDVTN